MPFANLGFETGKPGEPGAAGNWSIEYGVSVEVWAPYAGTYYIEPAETHESWAIGWQRELAATAAAEYAAALLATPNAFENHEVGWNNEVWLRDLGATASAEYGAALEPVETFSLEWNVADWQLGLGATTTAVYDGEACEDHEDGWDNNAWSTAIGATTSAMYDGGAEAVEDHEEVEPPIPFSVDPATGVLTANGHGLANGTLVRIRSAGQTPGGLSTALDYWVVNQATNTLQLARVPAGSATAIDHQGGGIHHLIPDPSLYWNDLLPD
jgi:hypothetical protein